MTRSDRPSRDEIDIAAYLGGDETGFTRLVDRYEHRLLSFATKVLDDFAAAQDLVQEAFVAAATGIESLNGADAFRAWIFRVTYFKCLKHLVVERRRPEWTSIGPGTEPVDPMSELRENEPASRLHALTQKLPAEDRAILEMRYVDDFTTRDIAEITGEKAETVRKRLYRIRMWLTDMFVSTPPEPGSGRESDQQEPREPRSRERGPRDERGPQGPGKNP